MVKPAHLRRSGFSCGKAHCNGLVSVPTLTRNRSCGLEPLLTLLAMNVTMGCKFQVIAILVPPFTPWLVQSDDVAVPRCIWRSRGWDWDGKARCRCIVFRCEEFHACYEDWRQRSSTGCGVLDHTECEALDDEEVIGIESWQLKSTSANPDRECTSCSSWVYWGPASQTEGSGGEIHFTWCCGNMEGSSKATGMLLVSVGRHWRSQIRFWRMEWWLGTWYFREFANFPMAERDISANACQWTCEVSWTLQRWPIT